jgi:RimJ/RimL family protein N-acetyltransferase
MNEPNYFFHLDVDFYFRELRLSDLEGRWHAWFNDPEVTKFQSKGFIPNTIEAQRQYYESLINNRSNVVLAIVDRATDQHIGNVGLHRIEEISRSAVLGIVLGEKSAWGRGIGGRSWSAITRYGFQVLNLHKITATVFEGNQPSLKCALKAGFNIEGRQKKQVYKNGLYVDLIHVGLLRDDWNNFQLTA